MNRIYKRAATVSAMEAMEPRTFLSGTPVPVGDEFRVNVATAGDQRFWGSQQNRVAGMDDVGNMVVTWKEPTSNAIVTRRFAAGGAAGAVVNVAVATKSVSDPREPNIDMNEAGQSVVAWMGNVGKGKSDWEIFARRYDTGGNAQGAEFKVNATTANQQMFPSVAVSDNGTFVVTWIGHNPGGTTYDVYAQRYSAAGVRVGGEIRVSNANSTSSGITHSVAMDAQGGFLIAWDAIPPGSSYQSFARRYSASGTPLTAVQLAPERVAPGRVAAPSVALDAAGNAVIAWTDSPDTGPAETSAQRFDAALQPLGAAFQVNTYTDGGQGAASVAMEPDGDFVISWVSSGGQDGSGTGIFAQRYRADGTPLGQEFQVNTYTQADQWYPCAVAAPDGQFAVVWTSDGQDGSGYGIYAQRFQTPADEPLFASGSGVFSPGDSDDSGPDLLDIIDEPLLG